MKKPEVMEKTRIRLALRWKTDEKFKRKSQLSSIKSRCADNGIPFDITIDDINWVDTCPILGVKLGRSKSSSSRNYSPSLDRIIPELGYVKGNVRVISKLANAMKQNATYEELKIFSQNILKYMEGKI